MADVTDTYYPGEAFTGYGVQLLVGQGGASPETFVAIADLETITPGDMSTTVIEKTHLRSPEAHKEKMAGLRDSGAFALGGQLAADARIAIERGRGRLHRGRPDRALADAEGEQLQDRAHGRIARHRVAVPRRGDEVPAGRDLW